MEMTVIAGTEDVIGFRLAGIPGTVCDTRDAVLLALERARQGGAALLVIVSAAAAALAPDEIRALTGRPGSPLIVILPAGETP